MSRGDPFEKLLQAFLAEYWQREPVNATACGIHSYDGTFRDDSAEAEADRLSWLENWIRRFKTARVGGLPASVRRDRTILLGRLEEKVFDTRTLRECERDPNYYVQVIGYGIDLLLKRDFAPLENRIAPAAETPSVAQLHDAEQARRSVVDRRKRPTFAPMTD